MNSSFDPAIVPLMGGHYIDGRIADQSGGLPMILPSDGTRFSDCPVGDANMVDRAVVAAQ